MLIEADLIGDVRVEVSPIARMFTLTFDAPSANTLSSDRLGDVFLDLGSLRSDVATLSRLPFDSFYERYSRGTWRSISILNRDGDHSNGENYEFEGRGRWTAHSNDLPYIKRFIETEFYIDRLKSARIFLAENGGMVVPHRDYLEFKDGFTRLHVPLLTSPFSLSTENNIAFHMNQGEIWYLNAKLTHAAANYGSEPRYHLVLDFPDKINRNSVIVNLRTSNNPVSFVRRNSLPRNFQKLLANIGASILSTSSVLRAFYLLCDYHFMYNSDANDVYDWLEIAAKKSKNDDNVVTAKEIRKQFIGE